MRNILFWQARVFAPCQSYDWWVKIVQWSIVSNYQKCRSLYTWTIFHAIKTMDCHCLTIKMKASKTLPSRCDRHQGILIHQFGRDHQHLIQYCLAYILTLFYHISDVIGKMEISLSILTFKTLGSLGWYVPQLFTYCVVQCSALCFLAILTSPHMVVFSYASLEVDILKDGYSVDMKMTMKENFKGVVCDPSISEN